MEFDSLILKYSTYLLARKCGTWLEINIIFSCSGRAQNWRKKPGGLFLENKRFFEGILNENGGAQKQNSESQVLDMSLDAAHKTLKEKLLLSFHLGLIIHTAEIHLSDFPPSLNLMSTAHNSLAVYPADVWDLQHLDQLVSSLIYKVLLNFFSPFIMDVQVFLSA